MMADVGYGRGIYVFTQKFSATQGGKTLILGLCLRVCLFRHLVADICRSAKAGYVTAVRSFENVPFAADQKAWYLSPTGPGFSGAAWKLHVPAEQISISSIVACVQNYVKIPFLSQLQTQMKMQFLSTQHHVSCYISIHLFLCKFWDRNAKILKNLNKQNKIVRLVLYQRRGCAKILHWKVLFVLGLKLHWYILAIAKNMLYGLKY